MQIAVFQDLASDLPASSHIAQEWATGVEIRVHAFAVPAPPPPIWLGAKPYAASVEGWLIEATDGNVSGWWGPVDRQIAQLALSIFKHTPQTAPRSPTEWAESFKRANRHCHAGLGAVAIGACELAIWDLIGKRESLPVFRLLGGEADCICNVYATCFGMPIDGAERVELASFFHDTSVIQKWDASGCPSPAKIDRLVEDAGSADLIALDFKGQLASERASAYTRDLPQGLAWIEEPLPPWRLADLRHINFTSPVAGGEHAYGPQEIPCLRAANVSVFQPDAVTCGGLGSMLEFTSQMSKPREVVAAHGGGLLPALHLAAATDLVDIIEWHLILEPRRQAHLARPMRLEEDFTLKVPQLPGWAGDLSPDMRFL